MIAAVRRPARWVLVLGCGMLSGCAALFGQSAPINYYLLNLVTVASPPKSGGGGPIFAVAPVRVPQYLSQRGLVTKTGENEIDVALDDQWGGALADNIAAVLSENISLMIPSDRVVELPVSAAVEVDYEVRVEVVGFERQPDGSVVLTARWTVFGDGGRRLVAMTRSGFRAVDVVNDYPSITRAMSSLLAELSREIATTLQRLPATAATS
ncbi:MAG: membrane integrity-associated transporter subunit PqiC [Bacteroidota bacterium]